MHRFAILLAILLSCAFFARAQNSAELRVGGGTISIDLPSDQTQPTREELLNWVQWSGIAVSEYFGRLPVSHLQLHIRGGDRAGVHHGMTYGEHGGLILITVGAGTTVQQLNDDWTMTHEMTHLAFPSLKRDHHWMEEGMATYVEPVARAQTKQMPVDEVWSQFVQNMAKGEPEEDDQGVDVTHTWGRTYWGGAMFCLIADVKIREETHNAKGLQDAFRGILDAGGNITQDWEIEKAFAAGDRATGTKVLTTLYRQWATHPVTVDLDALWKKLGVRIVNGAMVYEDAAPEAAIRKKITEPHSHAEERRKVGDLSKP